MGDKLWINGTLVHEVDALTASPAGYGYIRAVELDFGTPNQETFLDPRSLAPGMRFNGTLTKDRPFRVRFLISGVGTVPKGQDEWETMLGSITNIAGGLLSFKTARTDAAAATVTRELLAIATREPAWRYVEGANEDGLRPNGNIVIAFDCVAPFPWWRDASETTETIIFSGAATDVTDIDVGGHVNCGAEIKVATAGSLASIGVSDGTNTMSMTATFGASAKGVDWYHADPTTTSIDSGVVIGDLSHFELAYDGTTTVTCVSPGGASGSHTITIKYRRLWKSP